MQSEVLQHGTLLEEIQNKSQMAGNKEALDDNNQLNFNRA